MSNAEFHACILGAVDFQGHKDLINFLVANKIKRNDLLMNHGNILITQYGGIQIILLM